MKKINAEADGNIELQTILLANIEDFNKQQEAGREQNLSFHEMVANTKISRKKKKKENKDSDSPPDEGGRKARPIPEVEDEILRRGNLCFANWYGKTIKECLLYCDQQVDQALVMKMPLEGLQQLMEYCFDLRLKGNKDRVGTPHKRPLFANMRKVYIHLGSKLGNIIVDCETGTPDWESMSLFVVGQQLENVVTVTYKSDGPEGMCEGRIVVDAGEKGPWTVSSPWSIHQATLRSETSSYPILTAFPRFGKKLIRRPSEEHNASGHITEEMAEFAAQKKKDDSSKKRVSKVPMVPMQSPSPSQQGVHPGSSSDKAPAVSSHPAHAIEAMALETPPSKKARIEIFSSPTVQAASVKASLAKGQPDLVDEHGVLWFVGGGMVFREVGEDRELEKVEADDPHVPDAIVATAAMQQTEAVATKAQQAKQLQELQQSGGLGNQGANDAVAKAAATGGGGKILVVEGEAVLALSDGTGPSSAGGDAGGADLAAPAADGSGGDAGGELAAVAAEPDGEAKEDEGSGHEKSEEEKPPPPEPGTTM